MNTAIFVTFLLLVLGLLGLLIAVSKKEVDRYSYFLSSQRLPAILLGLCFLSYSSSPDLLLYLSTAATHDGLSVALPWLGLAAGFLLLVACFLPTFRRSFAPSVAGFFGQRFSSKVQTIVGIITWIVLSLRAILILWSGCFLISRTIGWNPAITCATASVIATLITLRSGANGSAVLESVGGLSIAICAVLIYSTALSSAAGWDGLEHRVEHISMGVDSGMTGDFLHLGGSVSGVSPVVNLILGFLYMLCRIPLSPVAVQRSLSTRTASSSKIAAITAGLVLIFIPLWWTTPGMISRLFFPRDLGCPRDGPCKDAPNALPFLVGSLITPVIQGAFAFAVVTQSSAALAASCNAAIASFTPPIIGKHGPSSPFSAPTQPLFTVAARSFAAFGFIVPVYTIVLMMEAMHFELLQMLEMCAWAPVYGLVLAAFVYPWLSAVGAVIGILVGGIGGVLWTIIQLSTTPDSGLLFLAGLRMAEGCFFAGATLVVSILCSLCWRGARTPSSSRLFPESCQRLLDCLASRRASTREYVPQEDVELAPLAEADLNDEETKGSDSPSDVEAGDGTVLPLPRGDLESDLGEVVDSDAPSDAKPRWYQRYGQCNATTVGAVVVCALNVGVLIYFW